MARKTASRLAALRPVFKKSSTCCGVREGQFVAFWLLQCVYTIAPQEVGVELLFGKPKPELSEPGLHFLVWPIETVERVAVTGEPARKWMSLAQCFAGPPEDPPSAGTRFTANLVP